MEQIKLSKSAERSIVLSQLTENSSMLINFDDLVLLLGCSYDKVQDSISKKPDFPAAVEEVNKKNKLFRSGDVIKWIKRHSAKKK